MLQRADPENSDELSSCKASLDYRHYRVKVILTLLYSYFFDLRAFHSSYQLADRHDVGACCCVGVGAGTSCVDIYFYARRARAWTEFYEYVVVFS